uniref:EF-hand domain-containing protein n=1 Tax=Trichogramma kaykai TaxID=54128 RepID=A0ABD2W966_9HYME
MYDINGDGCISKGELGEIISSVHELMGRKHRETEERQAREQLEKVFRKLDLNQDGVITIEEFMESCLKDEVITRSLQMFDSDL